MHSDESADAIRKRMAELRQELTYDVRNVKRSTQEMTNPMYYLRRFPWASAAVAAAVGYMLVPKKKAPEIKPDPEMLAEFLRKHQIPVGESPGVKADTQGMIKSLAVMGFTWALRTGLTYAGQRIAAAAMDMTKPTTESDSEPQPSSASEEAWTTPR